MDTLTASLLAAARAHPDREFLRQPDGLTFSNAELLDRTGRIAHALAVNGVSAGDRVAVQVEKSVDAVCLYLATLRCGAVFLPLNPGYTSAELSYFLADAKPALFVCGENRLEAAAQARVRSLGGQSGLIAESRPLPSEFEDARTSPEDLAAILYTSGTTGHCKGAMITCGNLLSNAEALVRAWQISSSDILLHALPIFHVHGLFVGLNTLLLAGGRLDFHRRFEPEQIVRRLPEATILMGVPTFYTRLLEQADLAEAARNMRLFISGSAPLPSETHRRFHAVTGHSVLERYGMTETGMITSNPYAGERRPGAVGFPLDGVDLRIANESGRALPNGEIGIIELRGPNVFKGYWGMPEKTAAEFRADRYFITGDLGMIDEDGYVHIVGRQKDLIITGGYNVYPKEVEDEIDRLPGIVESAVIGLPHEDYGEAVTAIIVPKPGAHPEEHEIIAALADRLARFKQPKRIVPVSELPRNMMGKVQKSELRQRFVDLYRQLP